MQGKQGVILYLKQWASQHGSLPGHCFQLAKTAGVTDREFREAVSRGLALYEERQQRNTSRRRAA
ncbi:MAG: hypothetical protein KKG00_14160 [Bacteroidetes bacterium]|nr:hypothetical protein [Bacteroidota bacterium]